MRTTLPSGLTIPGPTFTGTMTMPDAATWTAAGISKAAAISTGSATIPAGGNINVSGQYQVSGSQIAGLAPAQFSKSFNIFLWLRPSEVE